MNKKVKNIIFDLGGVLLNIDYNRCSKAFLNHGFVEFDSFYSQAKQSSLFDDFETGRINEDEFCFEIFKISGLDKEVVKKCWNAMLLDFPEDRVEFLRTIKGKYRLFLLSNTNKIHLDSFRSNLIKKYGSDVLEDLFEKVYYSHEIGLRKPNSDCFEFVLLENDLSKDETVFIDDSIQHIEGASKLGIQSYWLSAGKQVTSVFPDIIR